MQPAITTIKDLVQSAGNSGLNALLLKDGDSYSEISYKQQLEAVETLARCFIALGIRKGDKIGIMSENRAEYHTVYLAVTCIGAVIVPVSILWEPPELIAVAQNSDMRLIFASQNYIGKIAQMQPKVPHLEQVVCFEPLQEFQKETYHYYPQFLEKWSTDVVSRIDVFSHVSVQPDDIAEILFVSYKLGVLLSHRALISNVEGLFRALDGGKEAGKKLMMIIPYSHLYPSVFAVLLSMRAGWSVLPTATARMDHILKMVKETRPNYIALVPLLLERMHMRLEGRIKRKNRSLEDLGLQDLDAVFVAGVKCPEDLIAQVEDLGLIVLEGYGLSEMAPFISMGTVQRHRCGSVGPALPNVELKIANPDAGGNGEILARGDNTMSGYYKLPACEEGTVPGSVFIDAEGWLHSGDIGRVDDDGFLYITGRSRNIIVSKGGTNIYPSDIEERLLESPLIKKVKVVPRWDEVNGQHPFALITIEKDALQVKDPLTGNVITRNPAEAVKEEINNFMGKLAAYKIPKNFEIIEE
ncbi:MAG: acyl--CoA ligase [bacterium]|nr:acyl--CoA ligase [bacterium]